MGSQKLGRSGIEPRAEFVYLFMQTVTLKIWLTQYQNIRKRSSRYTYNNTRPEKADKDTKRFREHRWTAGVKNYVHEVKHYKTSLKITPSVSQKSTGAIGTIKTKQTPPHLVRHVYYQYFFTTPVIYPQKRPFIVSWQRQDYQNETKSAIFRIPSTLSTIFWPTPLNL